NPAAVPAGTKPAPAVAFDQPVTIRLWHTQTAGNEKALLALIDRFNQTNGKNITVKPEYQGNYTDLFKKTMAAIQAKDPPELADAVKKTTKKDGGQTTAYGWAVPVSASTFNGWVLSRGSPLMSPDNTKVAWGGQAGLDSLTLVDDMFKGGYAYRPQGFDYQND